MGVPAFFRWLSRKYPSVIVYCNEERLEVVEGVTIPIDSSKPNPNNVEFDNLYLDMNGIIHPCTHPEDKPAPKDEDEMMAAIFQCIDRLFNIVRPRKLLYMAIDGVAPRAKMNQQRSRRFRASKETNEKINEIAERRRELLDKGAHLPPEKPKESHFDSNCITPGTPFMARLSTCLHYYIHERLNNDPGWKNIKVILSDANVPGEGEHKIMDYIRRQRAQPDHDPNTQHVLCGADADLIMLGLATHEPNFTIIREEFRPNKPRPCDLCSQVGHDMKDCVGCPKQVEGTVEGEGPVFGDEIPFIFVRLSVLREYLQKELQMVNLPFKYDFERAVDDWVFMCFFVGNDFLPHLPSLEIREGAIDRLVSMYKDCVYKTGGFVTDSGNVNLSRVQLIMNELGKVEDEIFKKRQQTELMFKQREKNKKRMAAERDGKPSFMLGGQYTPSALGRNAATILNPRREAYEGRVQGMHSQAGGSFDPNQEPGKRKHEDEEEEETHDEVRLWEDGFKDRYYESKFDVSADNIPFRVRVAHEYVRGLCWVLRYYYQGCASWKWYFPYHYAPFASDFVNVGDLSTEFEKNTKPFQPLQQLMGVFPAASSSHVPKPWAQLMHDPFSPIIDFYPSDFKIDLNGKKFAWQGVALLPFVDENRLFKALKPYYDDLTPAERKRNIRGDDRLYVGPGNKGFSFLKALYDEKGDNADEEIDLGVEGMRGKVLITTECVSFDGELLSPVRGLVNLYSNQVVTVRFRDPVYPVNFIFPAKRLKGALDPPIVLKPGSLDREQSRNWRPTIGMAQSNQRANLSNSGHRMVDHHSRSAMAHNESLPGSLMYSAVPPPSAMPLMHGSRSTVPPYHRGMQSSNEQRNRGQPGGYGYQSREQNWRSERQEVGGSRYQRQDRGDGGYQRQNVGDSRYQRQNVGDGRYQRQDSTDNRYQRQDSGDSRYQRQDRPQQSRGYQQSHEGGYQQGQRPYQQRSQGGWNNDREQQSSRNTGNYNNRQNYQSQRPPSSSGSNQQGTSSGGYRRYN